MKNRCLVVLVGTQVPGNLGATARVMHNFGLSDLVLVRPEVDRADRQARQMSTHGEEILDRCRIVGELGEAAGDCVFVAGTSARTGGLFRKQSVGSPNEIMPKLVEAAATGPVALVFGPEPKGLCNEEVARCNYLIHIPTDEAYPALNLAQAVAICLYELHMAGLKREGPAERTSPAPASFAEQECMYAHLRTALEELHFLYGEKADALMHALRHLIGRAAPTPMEVDVLHGLARQMEWFARNHLTHPAPPPPPTLPNP
jgi:TrmH family RNA methyltransferase